MKTLILALESSFTMFVKTKLPKRWAYFAEVASYLKSKGHDIDVMDCLNPAISHGEVLQKIAENDYDLIILLARPETARSIIKLSPFIKQISSKSKVLIYGDVTNYFPNFFKNDFIDAIIVSGDWECGLDDYFDFLQGKKSVDQLEGISCNTGDGWTEGKPGRLFDGKDWVFPDISTEGFIDKELYFSIDEQLTITVSRGCPFNCTFCPAVITFGSNDRRMPVAKVVEYIKENKGKFKVLKLFSPTFTFNAEWVKALCKLMIDSDCIVPWTCTSRPDCLEDLEMIELMAKAGCKRVAIGIETLDKESGQGLKKFRNMDDYIDLVKKVFSDLIKVGIEPKPLMMLGLKGQTRKNVEASFDLLKSFGAKDIRAASYSPRQLLRSKDADGSLDIDQIERMDKMTYQHIELPGINREEYLRLIYNTNSYKDILK